MSESTAEPSDVVGDSVQEIYCWRDMNRVCGPDCVAYLVETSEETRCRLLSEQRLIRKRIGMVAERVRP